MKMIYCRSVTIGQHALLHGSATDAVIHIQFNGGLLSMTYEVMVVIITS